MGDLGPAFICTSLLLAGMCIYSAASVPILHYHTNPSSLASGFQSQTGTVEASSFIGQEVPGFLPSPVYKSHYWNSWFIWCNPIQKIHFHDLYSFYRCYFSREILPDTKGWTLLIKWSWICWVAMSRVIIAPHEMPCRVSGGTLKGYIVKAKRMLMFSLVHIYKQVYKFKQIQVVFKLQTQRAKHTTTVILYGLSQSPSWFFYCFVFSTVFMIFLLIESDTPLPLVRMASMFWHQREAFGTNFPSSHAGFPAVTILFILGLWPFPQLLSLEVQVLPSSSWLQCSAEGTGNLF